MLRETDRSRFVELVRERTGMELAGNRLRDLDRGIQRTLEIGGIADMDHLYERLRDREGGGELLRILMSEVTIGETHFFRNRAQFDALEQRILPDIITRQRKDRRLRIWSAGCSSGEEPYSLAIAVRRILPDISNWDITILATDIDVNAMAKAERGVYTDWSFREVPEEIESSYFVRKGRQREVLPSIRDMVTFEYLNLAEDVYPSLVTRTNSMDLIVCRNVLIYIDDATTKRIADGFYESLTGGGWLVVGPAEPSQAVFHRFAVHNFPRTVIYQRTAATPPPRARQVAPRPSTIAAVPVVKPRAEEPPRPRVLPVEMPRPAEPVAGQSVEEATQTFRTAKVLANRLEFEEARRLLTKSIEQTPLFAPAHHLQGLILQEEGDLEGALASFRSCIYADPGFALGHFGMADLLVRTGKKRRALKALQSVERALEGCPMDAHVDGGDGLTVGRLRELVAIQKRQWV